MEQALIYCRVSTEEQAKNNNSLLTQENFCKKFAGDNDYEVAGIYVDEGKSATNLNRPALQDMLARCQQDKSINIVIVQETDRLARNTNDHSTIKTVLKKVGVKVISVAQPMIDDSPEGNMIDTIVASVNQFQSQITGRKTKKGMQTKFDLGDYPGWAPIGYLNKRIDGNGDVQEFQKRSLANEDYFTKKSKTKGIIIKDPEKFDLVKQGLKMYLTDNYSALEISDILYTKGLRSKNDKRICNSVMIKILRDPYYCGILRWNGQEKTGNHEAMISVEEHNRITNIMDIHNMHQSRRRIHNFLLRGFIFCDICQGRYVAEKRRPGKSHDYYRCGIKVISMSHSNKGQNITAEELEEQVENQFKTIKFSETFIKLIIHKVEKYYEKQQKDKKQKVRIQLNKKMGIEKYREVAEKKLISGILDDEDYGRIKDRLRGEENDINSQIGELERENEIDFETIRKILMLARDVYGAYKKAPNDLKRLYLSLFWEGFWVKDRIIVRSEPTKIIKTFQNERKVLLRSYWCPRRESNPHEVSLKGF